MIVVFLSGRLGFCVDWLYVFCTSQERLAGQIISEMPCIVSSLPFSLTRFNCTWL